jgi:ubiquinone/menaquinone biosynthesis C-methylase UbiE
MKSAQFQLHAAIEDNHWWFVARRRILVGLVERLVEPGSSVLDVGCGTGANIAALSDRYICTGIDNSSQAIETARERFPNVRFLHGEAPSALAGEWDKIDLFMLTDVLEHIEHDVDFLTDLVVRSRPGAQFLVTVPAGPDLWSQHDVSFGHFRRYTRATLAELFHGLPTESVLISYYNSRLLPLVKAARTLSRLMRRPLGRAGTDFHMAPSPINRSLTEVFAGEGRRLLSILDGKGTPYGDGVSLIGVWRRTG